MVLIKRSTKDVTGYILAGGQSRRMGFDKRMLKAGRITFLERSSGLLESILGKKPVFVGDNLELKATQGCRIVRDRVPNCGPLSGLAALLQDCPTQWALVLAVDLPYLSCHELELLINAPRNSFDVLTLTQSGKPEPMSALYNTARKDFWELMLLSNKLGIQAGIRQLKWCAVYLPEESSALKNMNTLQDLPETIAI